MRHSPTFLLVAFLTVGLHAQTYERVLIPISTFSTPGQFGSEWVTYLQAYNGEPELRDIDYNQKCVFECPPRALPAHTKTNLFSLPKTESYPGLIVYVQQPSSLVTFSLRVRDLSRQLATYGTEIPVVRDQSFYATAIRLMSIPISGAFRHAIRIYSMDSSADAQVRVTVVGNHGFGEPGVILGTAVLTLQRPLTTPDKVKYEPLYAQILDLSAIAQSFGDYTAVDVDVAPASAGLRFWAFASITNNDTQHVTTITPQEIPAN